MVVGVRVGVDAVAVVAVVAVDVISEKLMLLLM